jgi:cupin 2 domain-containing protein
LKKNLLKDLETRNDQERFEDILSRKGLRIERIVSNGHASAPDFWYEQDHDEWVLIFSGEAELEFESNLLKMMPGDYILIEAGKRHRVRSTSLTEPTVWLAIHLSVTTIL